jgi:hypothetical protein
VVCRDEEWASTKGSGEEGSEASGGLIDFTGVSMDLSDGVGGGGLFSSALAVRVGEKESMLKEGIDASDCTLIGRGVE